MRKTIVVSCLVLLGLSAWAAEVELLFFYLEGCSVCAPVKTFLEELVERYPELEVVPYEVGFSPRNYRLMIRLADAYGLDDVEVPVVFVGDLGVSGPGAQNELLIEEEVQRCIREGCPSPMERLKEGRWTPVLSPLETVVVVLFLAWALYLILAPLGSQ